MKNYKATKKTADSNTVVEQLNAKVLTATFANKTGEQLADLYTCEGTVCRSPKELVAHGTCPPALGIFVETIAITFD